MSTDRLTTLLQEYADLEKRMEDPSIHADQALVRRVGRRRHHRLERGALAGREHDEARGVSHRALHPASLASSGQARTPALRSSQRLGRPTSPAWCI